ncbi:HAD-IIA family hydrolase [Oscillochloris sp. ZM17-4]|uniref:HAD-IIA family hydrolase n=1 Tax=Oscillochloris sp. ZM17-4 TaxID=2866714 RepID=UPI001C731789|nr:HAD-IIA family hydrolase [Oscillochloris sp. ZM17-4]MBX0326187.1 HAD-IIA family hydrolase [Oscillochloris sp. ZM17-4]
MIDLSAIRAVLFDMDGVLYRGKQMLAGVPELLAFLGERGIGYACITNNASMTPGQYEEKLGAMGIAMPARLVLTSALATSRHLRGAFPPGTRVLIVGMRGLREALLGDGYFVEDRASPELVVQGADFELTYATLKGAALAIRHGARFVATNPDRTFPSEEGLIPGAGATTAALVAATDVQPLVIGKPAPTMFLVAAEMLGVEPGQTLVIGDRLDTDIAGANNAGMPSAMVLTGVSQRADVGAGPGTPDLIVASLPDLLGAWRDAR